MATETPCLEELAERMPPPDWLVEMHDHFAKTGHYRPKDLERVLGDQSKGVSMDPHEAEKLLARCGR